MIDDIDVIQKELENLIDFYEDKNLQSLPYNKCFAKTIRMLDRAKSEFNANLFFILLFGPLKAGKSTLTNLLAREYVSPTGFGIETTLRPSLIMKSRTKEYSIDCYEMVNTKEDKEELFNQVMDVLRGILDFSSIKSRVRKVSMPLTQQFVEERLIRYLDCEPLITVLNVPGGDLVTEQIALIDMPGLDGIKSNWEDSVVHKWILKRADFLIFIQSSMAALNKATFEFLKDAYLGSKKPPLWLVQNIIDAKYWRSDEDRRSDNDAQRRNAKEHISGLLGISEDLRSTAINLGKALDGMNADNFRYLLDESGFIDFENDLKDILNESRVYIQQENSVKGVLRTVKDVGVEFERYKEELAGKRAEYDEQEKVLAKPRIILDEMYKVSTKEIKERLKNTLEKEYMEGWRNKCYRSLDKDELFAGLGNDMTREILVKRIEKAADEINNSRRKDYLEESDNFKKTIKNFVEQYIDLQKDNLTKLNNSMIKQGMPPYENSFCFAPKLSLGAFAPMISTEISNKINRANIFTFGFGKKKLDKVDAYKSELCDVLKREYGEYADQLMNKMVSEIFEKFDMWVQHSYIGELNRYLEEKIDCKRQEILQEKDKIEATWEYIEQLEQECSKLQQFIEDYEEKKVAARSEGVKADRSQ